MKKLFLVVLTFMSMLFLNSCGSDDSIAEVKSYVEATVMSSGVTQSGKTVYMFGENKGPNTNFFKPLFSTKSVITESNGVATFNLQDTFDLDVIDSQTTLYFGVFDSNDNVLGSTAVTVEKGQTKSVTINY